MSKQREYWRSQGLGKEYDLIVSYVQLRRIEYLSDLPEKSQNKILTALQLARRMFPDNDIYLTGSYAVGMYRDETTPKPVLQAFDRLYGKKGYSDVDFYIKGIKERIKLSDEAEIIDSCRSAKIKINDKI